MSRDSGSGLVGSRSLWSSWPLFFVLVAVAPGGCNQSALLIVDDAATPPDMTAPPPPDMASPPVDIAWTPPPPAGVSVQMIGSWLRCNVTYTFNPDNTFKVDTLFQGCSSLGHWSIHPGDLLDLTYDSTTCMAMPANAIGARVIQQPGGITLVYAGGTRISSYANAKAQRIRWDFKGRGRSMNELTSILRIIKSEGGAYNSACYYSLPGQCGAVSCNGDVNMWDIANGVLTAEFSCTGYCPCGAFLTGKATDTHVEGTIAGVNCAGTYNGVFSADVVPDL